MINRRDFLSKLMGAGVAATFALPAWLVRLVTPTWVSYRFKFTTIVAPNSKFRFRRLQ